MSILIKGLDIPKSEHERITVQIGSDGAVYLVTDFELKAEVYKFNAVEVKHGHWIEYDDIVISCECSVCGEKFNLYEDDVFGYPYCPNCGAKMDGKEEE